MFDHGENQERIDVQIFVVQTIVHVVDLVLETLICEPAHPFTVGVKGRWIVMLIADLGERNKTFFFCVGTARGFPDALEDTFHDLRTVR